MHEPLPHRSVPVAHTLHRARDPEQRQPAQGRRGQVRGRPFDGSSVRGLCRHDGPVQVSLIPSERIHFGKRLMGVDREYFSDADPIAFEAAQAVVGIQPNEDRSRTASSVMFGLSVKQRERFEDLVARAGL